MDQREERRTGIRASLESIHLHKHVSRCFYRRALGNSNPPPHRIHVSVKACAGLNSDKLVLSLPWLPLVAGETVSEHPLCMRLGSVFCPTKQQKRAWPWPSGVSRQCECSCLDGAVS